MGKDWCIIPSIASVLITQHAQFAADGALSLDMWATTHSLNMLNR